MPLKFKLFSILKIETRDGSYLI